MKKGFSLIEIITILFIVAIGLLGVLSLIIQNIQSQTYNKNNLIAFQLAQEGIELVRSVRDTNWREGNVAYDDGLYDVSGDDYYMDFEDAEPHRYTSSNSEGILALRKGEDGFYRHGGSDPSSGFSRLITIDRLDANSMLVDVHITWTERGRNSTYDLQTELYRWQ